MNYIMIHEYMNTYSFLNIKNDALTSFFAIHYIETARRLYLIFSLDKVLSGSYETKRLRKQTM